MKDSSWVHAGAKNIALLLLVFLPLFLVLAGILARIVGLDPAGDVLGTASVLYPGFLGPVLLGGVVYLISMFALSERRLIGQRALAVILTPVIALGFAPFGVRHVLTIVHFLIAFVISLVVYGLLVRIPRVRSG